MSSKLGKHEVSKETKLVLEKWNYYYLRFWNNILFYWYSLEIQICDRKPPKVVVHYQLALVKRIDRLHLKTLYFFSETRFLVKRQKNVLVVTKSKLSVGSHNFQLYRLVWFNSKRYRNKHFSAIDKTYFLLQRKNW